MTTLKPYFDLRFFGAFKLDMLYNEKRPLSSGTPFFLLPDSVANLDQHTFDMHARQSTFGASLRGPEFAGLQSGATAVAMIYNDAVTVDQYGFLPLQAFGELRNDQWRFAAGLQFDIFSPVVPTILPFSALGGSGNSGNAFRGQVRLERFIQISSDVQWTMQAGLSDPIPTTITPDFGILSEDNGWPNVEGRVALGLGSLDPATGQRPFELGVSGIVGEIRTIVPATSQVVADVWGVGTDLRWRVNDYFGLAGEWYTGEAVGTYNAAILQTVNTVTFEGIRSTGGFVETYLYWTPCLHSHLGYGIDNPDDRDVAALGRTRNETYFANLLWDLNSTFRLGFEFTWRETAYIAAPNNEGPGFHTQFQWTF